MADADDMLAVYDEQMRGAPPHPRAGVRYERDGPVLRVVGGPSRGFVSCPRDVGVRGADLDRLIRRQRDYFAARGEAVEWKIRGHDRPADLAGRLRAAGFVPEEPKTVQTTAPRRGTSRHDRRIGNLPAVRHPRDSGPVLPLGGATPRVKRSPAGIAGRQDVWI